VPLRCSTPLLPPSPPVRVVIVLRCFLSGVTPCDSIGAIDPASIDAAAMELARTNLLHRCLLEGSLVEREK